jgi:hypothetical protein
MSAKQYDPRCGCDWCCSIRAAEAAAFFDAVADRVQQHENPKSVSAALIDVVSCLISTN